MKLGSVRGKFPVHARRDGKEAEEGWDGDGRAAHSAVHSAVAAKSTQATGGASQHEEQNADDMEWPVTRDSSTAVSGLSGVI